MDWESGGGPPKEVKTLFPEEEESGLGWPKQQMASQTSSPGAELTGCQTSDLWLPGDPELPRPFTARFPASERKGLRAPK